MIVHLLSLLSTAASVFASLGAPCCVQVSGSCRTACEQMSLMSVATNGEERQKHLHVLDVYCPKTLGSFWSCLNDTLSEVDRGEGFSGRPCCHLLQSETCQMCCLQAQNRNGLLKGGCRESDEMAFYSCLQWQEIGDRCCLSAQTSECHRACREVFVESQTPGPLVLAAVDDLCSLRSRRVVDCVSNYTRTTPSADPRRNLQCCETSQNEQCRTTCRKVLRSNSSSQEVVMDTLIEGGCGHPVIHDSLWQCFLANSDSNRPNSVVSSASRLGKIGRDGAKLHCCFKAATLVCQKLCFKTFGREWETSWKNFHHHCLYQPSESKMLRCLEEVEEPCDLGCEGLSYCGNFNNRPTLMFRSCNAWSDQTARNEFQTWRSGYINTSMVTIPVVDTGQCFPTMWKGIACMLAIKPCTTRHSFSGLCWADCVEALTKCLDYGRMTTGLTAESICETLLPNGHDASCTPLSSYTNGNLYDQKSREVTFPCRPNPCNLTSVCLVNWDCKSGERCLPYKCVPGCRMGDASNLVVPRGSLVNIPTSATNSGCQKVCRCTSRSTFDECVTLPCQPTDGCWIGDKRIAHKATFQLDCNTCACYAGEVTCSNLACMAQSGDPGMTGLPCNCPDHYVPVCGANGRTYPSACVASCAGLTDRTMEFGACGAIDPCQPNPCKRWHRCLPIRRVCLTFSQKSCPQYECVDVNLECTAGRSNLVCDTSHQTHPSVCSLLRRDRILAYTGPCLENCRQMGPVCGQNGETYATECAAWANHLYVDYEGPCRSFGVTSDGVVVKCKDVQCPQLPHSLQCHTVVPSGACCPICGSALKLLFSKKQMERIEMVPKDRPPLTVGDVVLSFRRHVRVAQCDVFGYLAVDGELVLVVTSPTALSAASSSVPSLVQLEACTREADKLEAMVQLQSPLFLSDYTLSAILSSKAVHVHASDAVEAATILNFLLIVCLLSFTVVARYQT